MDETLRRLQLTELEILKIIDGFCTEYNISYSLYCGTLLGAVRHKGFISWDDDLDICMLRENYDRFLELWEKSGPEGYVLQNKENSPEFNQSFTKIRKDHTTFLQQGEQNVSYHTGIFVDIFPIDCVPNGFIQRKLRIFRVMRYLLYTREFAPSSEKGSRLERIMSGVFLKLVPAKRRGKARRKLLRKITRYNDNKSLMKASIATLAGAKIYHRPDYLDEITKLPFEDGEFPCCACWDENLRVTYGDYMKFPPKEQQVWTHSPVIIDFDHNFSEICNETMGK